MNYKNKFNSNVSSERHNARLEVGGNFTQTGVDYKETFAHVARILLFVAVNHEWPL